MSSTERRPTTVAVTLGIWGATVASGVWVAFHPDSGELFLVPGLLTAVLWARMAGFRGWQMLIGPFILVFGTRRASHSGAKATDSRQTSGRAPTVAAEARRVDGAAGPEPTGEASKASEGSRSRMDGEREVDAASELPE